MSVGGSVPLCVCGLRGGGKKGMGREVGGLGEGDTFRSQKLKLV